jgi:predicted Rossmann fold nucleotide-binding protein DprA/Smf involved in DNA uptake
MALDLEDAQDIDELSARTGLLPGPLLARLSELELSGRAARRPGGRFVRFSGKVIT